jgi:hypothetical protein
MHDHATFDWAYWINWAANLLIVAGYVVVPFTVLRHLPLTRNVHISGSFFFGFCAITHLAMAFGFEHAGLMLANHIAQAVAVIWFVLAFYRLLRAASAKRISSAGGGDRQ